MIDFYYKNTTTLTVIVTLMDWYWLADAGRIITIFYLFKRYRMVCIKSLWAPFFARPET
jgi:hypothetical protein